jgi:putative ABC transport system permease protein
LTDQDNVLRTFPVAAVCENYVNHFVYLSETAYEQAGGTYESNVAVMKLRDPSPAAQSSLATALTATDGVLTHSFTADTRESVVGMFEQLNIIVFVLIVCAGALALAVLFNLNNINIAERIRELATIKVLGFLQKEVASYVMRESIILTAIGIIVGCFGGIFLHRFVMSTAEVEMVMFGRQIAVASFSSSILMTRGFAAIVSIALLPKLSRIDMVESLKSVE